MLHGWRVTVAVLVDGGGGCGELGLSSGGVGGAPTLLASFLLGCLLQIFAVASRDLLLLGSVLLLRTLVVASVELECDGGTWRWSGAETDGNRATGC